MGVDVSVLPSFTMLVAWQMALVLPWPERSREEKGMDEEGEGEEEREGEESALLGSLFVAKLSFFSLRMQEALVLREEAAGAVLESWKLQASSAIVVVILLPPLFLFLFVGERWGR